MRYWRTSLPYDFIMVFLVIIQKKKIWVISFGMLQEQPRETEYKSWKKISQSNYHVSSIVSSNICINVSSKRWNEGGFFFLLWEREREINKILNYKEKSKKKNSKRRFSLFSFLMTKYAMKDAQKDHQSKTLMVWTFFLNKKYIPQGLYLQFCPICYHTLIYFSRFV